MAADNNSAQQSLPEELRKEGTQPPRSQEPSKKKATPKWLIKLAAFLALFAGFVCWKLFGIVGLLVASFIVVPLCTWLFTFIFSGGKQGQAFVDSNILVEKIAVEQRPAASKQGPDRKWQERKQDLDKHIVEYEKGNLDLAKISKLRFYYACNDCLVRFYETAS